MRNKLWMSLMACAVITSPLGPSKAANLQAGRPLVVQPECRTKINYNLDNPPFWVFVMNFERMKDGNPVGCMLLYEAVGKPPRQQLLETCSIFGDVAVSNGRAVFNDGQVSCTVNLSELLGLAASTTYTTYSVFGMGVISPAAESVHPFGNPIGFYRSLQPGADLGLFAPATLVGSGHSLGVLKPMVVPLTTTGFFAPAAPANPQYWGVVFNGNKNPGATTDIGEMHMIVDGYTLEKRPMGRTTYQFRADGGVFFVGGSPLGPNFRGTLDEVIIDPQNGGSPDTIVELEAPRVRSNFLPGVLR